MDSLEIYLHSVDHQIDLKGAGHARIDLR